MHTKGSLKILWSPRTTTGSLMRTMAATKSSPSQVDGTTNLFFFSNRGRCVAFKACTNEDSENVEWSRVGEPKNEQQPLAVDICSSEHMSVSRRDTQENDFVIHNRYDLKHKSMEGQGVADNPTNISFLEKSNQIKRTFHEKIDASRSSEQQDDASKSLQSSKDANKQI